MNRKILALFSCILLSLSLSVSVQAYNTFGWVWGTKNIKYYYDNYNSTTGKTTFSNGASAWSGLDATLSNSTASNYHIYCTETDSGSDDWDGMLDTYGWPPNEAILYLNRSCTRTWNNANARKSVAVHEFGHALGLDDNGYTRTIMNAYTWGGESRYGYYGITTPQSDDISGINALY